MKSRLKTYSTIVFMYLNIYGCMLFVPIVAFISLFFDEKNDELFAKNMLEVIECILNRTTFEYQAISKEKYVNYLTMVNMPFLNEILEWGGSIRGAWFDNSCSPVLFCQVTIPEQELTVFFKELLEWTNDVVF